MSALSYLCLDDCQTSSKHQLPCIRRVPDCEHDVEDGCSSSCNELIKKESVLAKGYCIPVKSYEHETTSLLRCNGGFEDILKRSKLFARNVLQSRQQKCEQRRPDDFSEDSAYSTCFRRICAESKDTDEIYNRVCKYVTKCSDNCFDSSFQFVVWLWQSHLLDINRVAANMLDLLETQTKIGPRTMPLTAYLCKGNVYLGRRFLKTMVALWERCPTKDAERAIDILLTEYPPSAFEAETLTQLEEKVLGDKNVSHDVAGKMVDCLSVCTWMERRRAGGAGESRSGALVDLLQLLDTHDVMTPHQMDGLLSHLSSLHNPHHLIREMLKWSLTMRSSVGASLVAQIVQRLNLSDLPSILLDFFRTHSPEEGTDTEKFIRHMSRLFCALSYSGVISHDALIRHEILTGGDCSTREDGGYSFPLLLRSLPVVGSKFLRSQRSHFLGHDAEVKAEGARGDKLYRKLENLLSQTLCVTPISFYNTRPPRLDGTIKEAKSLSCFEAHRLAENIGNFTINLVRDHCCYIGKVDCEGKGQMLPLPSAETFRGINELLGLSPDSLLFHRFILTILPLLRELATRHCSLSLYAGSSALFLFTHSLSSRLAFMASKTWSQIHSELGKLVSVLCPFHWQTRTLDMMADGEVLEYRGTQCVMCLGNRYENMEGRRKSLSLIEDATRDEFSKEEMEKRCLRVASLVASASEDEATAMENDIFARIKALRTKTPCVLSSATARTSLANTLALLAARGVVSPRKLMDEEFFPACNTKDSSDRACIRAQFALGIIKAMLVTSGSRPGRVETQFVCELLLGRFAFPLTTSLVDLMCIGHLPECWEETRSEARRVVDKLIRQQWLKREIALCIPFNIGTLSNHHEWRKIVRAVSSSRVEEGVVEGPKSPTLYSRLHPHTLHTLVHDAALVMLVDAKANPKGRTDKGKVAAFATRLIATARRHYDRMAAMERKERDKEDIYLGYSFIHKFLRLLLEICEQKKSGRVSSAVGAVAMAVYKAISEALMAPLRAVIKNHLPSSFNFSCVDRVLFQCGWRSADVKNQNEVLKELISFCSGALSTGGLGERQWLHEIMHLLGGCGMGNVSLLALLIRLIGSGTLQKELNRRSFASCLSTIDSLVTSHVLGGASSAREEYSRLCFFASEQSLMNYAMEMDDLRLRLPRLQTRTVPSFELSRRSISLLQVTGVEVRDSLSSFLLDQSVNLVSWRQRFEARPYLRSNWDWVTWLLSERVILQHTGRPQRMTRQAREDMQLLDAPPMEMTEEEKMKEMEDKKRLLEVDRKRKADEKRMKEEEKKRQEEDRRRREMEKEEEAARKRKADDEAPKKVQKKKSKKSTTPVLTLH